MADTRKSVECSYCGAAFSIKYNSDDITSPEFCCFCGESFEDPNEELEDEDDDGDMDACEESDGDENDSD